MSRNSEDIEIDGTRYTLTQYPATTAVKLLVKLTKVIGKPVAIITAAGLDASLSMSLVSEAVDALSQNLDPDQFDKMIKEILSGTRFHLEDGKSRELIFDMDFQGRIGHLFKLLKAVLQFQYSDFLGEIAAASSTLSARQTVPHIKAL